MMDSISRVVVSLEGGQNISLINSDEAESGPVEKGLNPGKCHDDKVSEVKNSNAGDDKTADDEVCEWLDGGNEEEEERISLGLIGKLWSERFLNPTTFIATIKNVWVIQHGVDINMIGKNTFQFQFYHWKDKERVLNGQPWHFDKVALLLTEMDDAQKPSDLQFFALPMWVRVYNVPFRGRYNEDNARILGNKIGDNIAMDKTDSLGMERSIRLRVSIDVRNSLKKQVTLIVRGG